MGEEFATTKFLLPRNQNNNNKISFRSVVLIPEESEDMWHAYNLIATGDLVKASTIRKVTSDD